MKYVGIRSCILLHNTYAQVKNVRLGHGCWAFLIAGVILSPRFVLRLVLGIVGLSIDSTTKPQPGGVKPCLNTAYMATHADFFCRY